MNFPIWQVRVKNDYDNYMGLVFEQICKEYLLQKKSTGEGESAAGGIK
jgi:hypothetical protein